MDKCLTKIKSKINKLRALESEDILIAVFDSNKNILFSDFMGSDNEVNQCSIDIRELTKVLVNNDTQFLYMFHNHPFNTSAPSYIDFDLTNTIFNLCNILNINFVDHIIVSKDYPDFSFNNCCVSFPVEDIDNATKDAIAEYMTDNNNKVLKMFCDRNNYNLSKIKEV